MLEKRPLIASRHAGVDLAGRSVLRDASLSVKPGEMVVIVGPNGAGKTTWLRALVGLVPLSAGEVEIEGRPLASLRRRDLARRAAYLPQETWTQFAVSVRDVVALGRYAHRGPFGRHDATDVAAVDEALRRADLTALADRPVTELSGGERRRAHLARAMAQGAPLLLLDEPTTALDVGHAREVMRTIEGHVARGGAAVLSLHDLTWAVRGPTHAVLLDGGRVTASGDPAAVLSGPEARAAFGVPLISISDPAAIVPGR